ncbi:MAG: tetratricopeptide repeat protein [Roseburia sp.]
MDKYEYKLKLDQMKSMAAEGNCETAAGIADSINWKKVKNVSALVKAGEIYEQAGRYEESKEVLLQAYDRSPIGRTIIYRLAEVAIKMKDFEEAQEYCDEFVEIAPHDNLKYVLRYNLSKAKGEGNQALISILEEYKEQEYTEEWAYELAYLYHKEGRSEDCIEACDELILWFGDGPYVERALELKMLYQPLTKQQEEKYRQFRQRHAGIVEIRPEDALESGEIVRETVQIPQVKEPSERFNTVNLQEELAKSMQQIMNATEKDTVDNSMDNIKKLVEEIPYLQIPHEKDDENASSGEHIETDEEINHSLKDNFNEMLAEDYDGQMSLFVPEKSAAERQITGQLDIDDILAEWEKTKRAAEAALQEAEQRKLESAKARALQEAGDIMERLVDVIPKLDSGLTPKDLLEQEYLQKQEQEAERMAEEAIAAGHQGNGVLAGAEKVGLTAAEMMALTGVNAVSDNFASGAKDAIEFAEDAPSWVAPQLNDMPVEEAGKLVASMNDFLQKEIDRLHTENSQIDERIAAVGTEQYKEDISEAEEPETEEPEVEEPELPEIELEPELLEEETPELEVEEPEVEEPEAEEPELPKIEIEPELFKEEAGKSEPEEPELPKIELEPEATEPELPEITEPELEEDEVESVHIITKLTEEQKEIFSYFVPISGMKEQLCQALTGLMQHFSNDKTSGRGNLIIQGGRGCGKTVLATDVVKVLQKEIGRPNGKIGKIEGSVLNQKDIVQLFKKVAGGCLIIEKAGEISRETAIKLSLLMENETSGLMVIIEDTQRGIAKALGKDEGFASKFTEKLNIPIFTSDELVAFAKTYANEAGYNIEEMAVLALYNRISNIQKVDQGTTLIEVKEIVDGAIEKVEKGGLKKAFSILTARRYDENDYIILHEKDFEN